MSRDVRGLRPRVARQPGERGSQVSAQGGPLGRHPAARPLPVTWPGPVPHSPRSAVSVCAQRGEPGRRVNPVGPREGSAGGGTRQRIGPSGTARGSRAGDGVGTGGSSRGAEQESSERSLRGRRPASPWAAAPSASLGTALQTQPSRPCPASPSRRRRSPGRGSLLPGNSRSPVKLAGVFIRKCLA